MSKNDGISGLVNDKLDKNNFHAWKFRMTNFLMGKGYWDYIDGNQEEMPELPDVNPTAEQIKVFKDWNQEVRKMMYWLSVSVQDTIIGHIQDATSPKQAWNTLVSVDTTNTKARKIELKNELNTVKKENLSISYYTLKIKGIVESLTFVSVHDTMIGHIQDATSPKQAWDMLVSVDTTNTKARKIQLKNELNTVKKENLPINYYTLKIKGIVQSLASIGVQVEDDDKVEVCLRGLTPAYKQFKTSIQTRENIPYSADLVPMLVVEEKKLGEKIHLLYKAKIILSKSSTQTEVEVEDVMQAKDEVVVMVTKIKASSSISQMMHIGQTVVDVEIIEAGGVKEVTKITKEIMEIMKIKNAGVVEEQVTLNVTVYQETRVAKDSKTIMHLLAKM
ncbi:hypothetical protein L7F22_013356 [Adiantum nelumboides]|nr:hypothetical protein [Adiantum nelumboides]